MSSTSETVDHELTAVKGLSNEGMVTYNKIAKGLFSHLQFKGAGMLQSMKPSEDEIIAYITQQLKDGLHPSMMEENEVNVMKEKYGDKWYTKWGYVEGDLDEIVTVSRG